MANERLLKSATCQAYAKQGNCELISLMQAEIEKDKRKCALCGLPMSNNPHTNAGKAGVTPDYLEIGTAEVCIPCTVKSRHQWAERALKAEAEIERAKREVAEALNDLCKHNWMSVSGGGSHYVSVAEVQKIIAKYLQPEKKEG